MKIGITYRYTKDPTGKRNRLYIPGEFKEVFDELGIVLVPIVSNVGLDEIVKLCDGLILPGSYADTNPKYYNELPLIGKQYDVDEYDYDSKVAKLFLKDNKPILGICGGHQELNVLFGGTLNQKIKNHSLGDNKHHINIEPNTFIYDVYGKETNVNSLHHQSIKDVAPGFVASAISDDGIIEAIEKDNILCVQWHPEIMKDFNFFRKYIDRYYK